MLRWLFRLLVVAAILAALAFAIARFLEREEDFEDLDDMEAGFDFHETPVEFDVPMEEPPAAMAVAAAGSADEASSEATSEVTGKLAGAPMGAAEDLAPLSVSENSAGGASGGGLRDIEGIGRTYEARLNSIGIGTLEQLASADPGAVAEQLGLSSRANVERWIAQARELAARGAQA
jgi:predicted flap endonuclease-1-like 5' DNA nuclease